MFYIAEPERDFTWSKLSGGVLESVRGLFWLNLDGRLILNFRSTNFSVLGVPKICMRRQSLTRDAPIATHWVLTLMEQRNVLMQTFLKSVHIEVLLSLIQVQRIEGKHGLGLQKVQLSVSQLLE
jgi:hypothetical protein